MMAPQFRILVAPNEDGYGPSALASYVVKALARNPACHVTVWNATRHTFNRSLYEGCDRIRVEAVDGIIELAKPGGRISLRDTLARVGSYRARSDAYPGGGRPCDFDLVLDIGVPAAARWAARSGVPALTLTDHPWSKTLAMILDDAEALGQRVTPEDRRRWFELIDEVRDDERHTQSLVVFPPFITPELFRRHWREQLGVEPRELPGVLGGAPDWDRDQARRWLGVTEPGPTVLIQTGDTPVLAGALERLVADFLLEDERLGVNVVIHVPRSIPSADFDDAGLTRVRRLRPVPGGTIQRILPAIDFMLTRAGGGSVNDAVACRVPFACVEEPGQSQIEEILRACCAAGLTRRIPRAEFNADPAGVARRQWDDPSLAAQNRQFAQRMEELPRGAEGTVADGIVRRLSGDYLPGA